MLFSLAMRTLYESSLHRYRRTFQEKMRKKNKSLGRRIPEAWMCTTAVATERGMVGMQNPGRAANLAVVGTDDAESNRSTNEQMPSLCPLRPRGDAKSNP